MSIIIVSMVNTRFSLIFKLTNGSDSLDFSVNELCGLFFFPPKCC